MTDFLPDPAEVTAVETIHGAGRTSDAMSGGRGEAAAPAIPATAVPAAPPSLKPCVFVWRLCEAPKRFREVTDRQGDNLWLVAIPASMPDFVPPPWLLRNVDEWALPNGDRVMVGN